MIRSVAAATRIADALHDPRGPLCRAQSSGAAFADGVEEYIRENGILHTPWKQDREMESDLVITDSPGDNLHEKESTILRILRGKGYDKPWNQKVFGLSHSALKHEGRLAPSAIALSRNEQYDRLREG